MTIRRGLTLSGVRYWTMQEICDETGLSYSYVVKARQDGRLKPCNLLNNKRTYYFRDDVVRAFMELVQAKIDPGYERAVS